MLLREASLAMAGSEEEREAIEAPDELDGGGGHKEHIAKAIAQKKNQTARLAALLESEVELLMRLPREVGELAAWLKDAQAEARKAKAKAEELEAYSAELAEKLHAAEEAARESRAALLQAEAKHEARLASELRAAAKKHERELSTTCRRASRRPPSRSSDSRRRCVRV